MGLLILVTFDDPVIFIHLDIFQNDIVLCTDFSFHF